jgi:hypothetical protein
MACGARTPAHTAAAPSRPLALGNAGPGIEQIYHPRPQSIAKFGGVRQCAAQPAVRAFPRHKLGRSGLGWFSLGVSLDQTGTWDALRLSLDWLLLWFQRNLYALAGGRSIEFS